ncbi:MAG: DNA-3-methyladenine glycosylase 2 family protein [Defluviitaleaceae bacterium]|nr:DNA-3-methyladenine glycosylase 2 family protein [Defluviitaleaceae bacterium]
MDYIQENNEISLHASFDLAQTLDCGQAFRWREIAPQKFVGIAHGRRLEISRKNDKVILHNVTVDEFEKIWKNYFDIERDYESLRKIFSADNEHLKNAVNFSPGLRLLKQDAWETLVSFILSQNANIPRIKKMIEALCEAFGEKLPCGEFDFPSPEVLNTLNETDLAPLRLGYRSGYVLDAARRVTGGTIDLHLCENLPSDELCEILQQIRGVGPKVAECVLLYGFGRIERYPTDVWIRRAMAKYFPDGFPKEICKFSGIAQQFLFHYIRNT